jgi:hypothetical protein
MEGWNHGLEVEAIHGKRFATRKQSKAQVLEYIQVNDHRIWLHSTPGDPSPEPLEMDHAAETGARNCQTRSAENFSITAYLPRYDSAHLRATRRKVRRRFKNS